MSPKTLHVIVNYNWKTILSDLEINFIMIYNKIKIKESILSELCQDRISLYTGQKRGGRFIIIIDYNVYGIKEDRRIRYKREIVLEKYIDFPTTENPGVNDEFNL
ncbi:hypothetical protein ACJX0J_031984, partial [Zea mays]